MIGHLSNEGRELLTDNLFHSLELGLNPLAEHDRNNPEFRELCALTDAAMLATSAIAYEPVPSQLKSRLLAAALTFFAQRH